MKKRKAKTIRTEERPRHELQTFKVRCSLENAFYLLVEAHDSDEAEIVAENYCRDKDRQEDCFWDSEATYRHSKFEAEET